MNAQVGERPHNGPTVIRAVDPDYTPEARAQKISGDVLVRARISTTGDVTDVKVVRSLGHGLDEKALEAVSKYKFRPATKDGSPVESTITIVVSFRIF